MFAYTLPRIPKIFGSVGERKLSVSILKSITNDFPDRELVDATEAMVVTVRKEDVDRGVRQDPRSCALSWACYREHEIEEAIIYRWAAYIVTPTQIVRYMLSWPAQGEVTAFDQHGTFELGKYRLKAPAPSLRLDARRGRTPASLKRGPHTSSHGRPRRIKKGVRTYSN
jgi:hypothetical protein